MPDFQYVAREMSGSQVTGVLSAQTEREALQNLVARQLFPVKISPAKSATATKAIASRRVAPRLLATFFAQMADLLHSGVPLLRSLELLERQTRHPTLKQVLQGVREQVANGTRLAEAMRGHPKTFNDLTISIIRAGEEGGFLEDSLKRIADFTEHQEELKSRVVGAITYPAVLAVLGTVVVVGMLVFFVPMFEDMFSTLKQNGTLPTATIVLLAFSKILQEWWIGLAVVIGLAVFGLRYYFNTKDGRHMADVLRLKTPGIGQVTRSLAVARFCRVLGTLLKNGVPLLNSLQIAKDATGNQILSNAIATAAENVSSGKTLAGPLRQSGQFPSDVIEMIAVGEEANNLEQVLVNVADKMERQTNRQLDMVVRLLEPLMLVMMASVILFVLIALMLPIFQSSGAL